MNDLDPRLQRAAAEYLEHKNARMRRNRKYGWIIIVVFALLVVGSVLMQRRAQDDFENDVQRTNEDYERRVKEMREEHERKVREMENRGPDQPAGWTKH